MVCANSNRITRVPPYSGSHLALDWFRIRDFHPLWFTFPGNSTIALDALMWSFNPDLWSVWAPPFSLAATWGIDYIFLLLLLLRCFNSQGSLLYTYVFSIGWLNFTSAGFPHSDISGSLITSISPKLFAGSRVLLRLLVPRHPPYALNNFSYLFFFSWISKVFCSKSILL